MHTIFNIIRKMASFYTIRRQVRQLIKELHQQGQPDIVIINVIEERFGFGRKATTEILQNLKELEALVESQKEPEKKPEKVKKHG